MSARTFLSGSGWSGNSLQPLGIRFEGLASQATGPQGGSYGRKKMPIA
jgi:hypothetical protein